VSSAAWSRRRHWIAVGCPWTPRGVARQVCLFHVSWPRRRCDVVEGRWQFRTTDAFVARPTIHRQPQQQPTLPQPSSMSARTSRSKAVINKTTTTNILHCGQFNIRYGPPVVQSWQCSGCASDWRSKGHWFDKNGGADD